MSEFRSAFELGGYGHSCAASINNSDARQFVHSLATPRAARLSNAAFQSA